MNATTSLATITRLMLGAIAGALVHHGYLASSGSEAFIGAGMLVATGAWGVWNGYGKDIAKASLDLLRAKVVNAAARANANPQAAPAALASVAAHVLATEPPPVPAPVGSRPVAPAIALLILGTALLGLLQPGAAYAQAQRQPASRPFIPTGNLPADIAATKAPPTVSANGAVNYDSIGDKLQAVVKDVIDKAITDLGAASKDAAGQVPPDLISQPCWDAQVAFLKLLPAEWPDPPKDVGPALAIQIGRDLRRALTGDQRGTIKVDCAALFGDELAQVGKLGSLLGLKLLTGGIAP